MLIAMVRLVASWLVPLLLIFAAIGVSRLQTRSLPCRLQNFETHVDRAEFVDGQLVHAGGPMIMTAWVHSSKQCSRCHDNMIDAAPHDPLYTLTVNGR